MLVIIPPSGQARTQPEKKPGGHEHTLPILFTDQRSGFQSDMLTKYIGTFPLFVKQNDAAPHRENPVGRTETHLFPGGLQVIFDFVSGFLFSDES